MASTTTRKKKPTAKAASTLSKRTTPHRERPHRAPSKAPDFGSVHPPLGDLSEMEHHVRALLTHIGEDPDREGLVETPARVLRAYQEHFSGYRDDASKHLTKTFGDVEGYDELVLISDIEMFSHCEHHLVPFVGKAHVGYIPNGRVVGLSKIARVVDVFAKRLQVQEKLTTQIADAIQTHLKPQGVAVVVQAQHFCMCYRGVKKPGSWTTTSKLHGCFLTDPAARMELLTLIGMRRDVCAG